MEKRVFLHFGAVDYKAVVYINGVKVGQHKGGYVSFSFEITDFTARLDATDEVTLTLTLDYPPDTAPNGPTTHHLGLAGVYVVGSTTAAGTSKGLVIAVIVLLSILVIGATALLAFGKKRRKEE